MSFITCLLGSVGVRRDGVWQPLPGDKRGALLFYLAYHGDWVSRERLAFLFWPDMPDAQAKRNLRRLLGRSRALGQAQGLEVEADRLRWQVATDVAAFKSAVGRQAWSEALKSYQGALGQALLGVAMEGFDAWLEFEREALHSLWQDAVLKRAAQLEAETRYQEAAQLLRPLLHDDELAEDVLQRYLAAAYSAGQRDQALKAYEAFASRLAAELGLEPLAETKALAETIRRAESLRPGKPAAPRPSAVPVTVLRPPRLVGREAAQRQVQEAAAPLVVLAGEAGVGKSRLLLELAPDALYLRCREGLQNVPYHPVTAQLRALAAAGTPLPSLDKYQSDVARLLPDLVPGAAPEPADPLTARARLLEALARLLEQLAEGTQLVFDDLQWADVGTLELLGFLAERGSLRLLGAFRDDERTPGLAAMLAALERVGKLGVVKLERLETEAIRKLMASLIGLEQGPPLFSTWLYRQSGGNPMFALETLKALFEAGDLRADASGWHSNLDAITQDYRELFVPQAVSKVIERRLARLSETSRRILQVAAVMGRVFAPKLLGPVSGLSEWAVIDALEEAEAYQLIAGESFSHDLLRESIYDHLNDASRRLLHARVAEVLTGRAEASEVAEHWLRAGEKEAAVACWLEAADDLWQRGLYEEALAVLERSEPHAAPPRSFEVQLRRARMSKELARHEVCDALVTALLEQDLSPKVRAEALEVHASNLTHLGRLEEAHAAALAGLAVAENVQDDRLRRDLLATRASIVFYQGDAEAAVALLEPLLPELRSSGLPLELSHLLRNLAALYDSLGRNAEALSLHLEALTLAKRLGAHSAQVDIALNLLYCYMDLGRIEEGLIHAEAALRLGRFEGTDSLRNNLAVALTESGRFREAQTHLQQLTVDCDDPTLLAIAWSRLADLYSRLELQDEMSEALEESLRHVERTQFGIARARVIVNVLRLGTPAQRARVEPLTAALEVALLPAYVREELEAARTDQVA